MTLSEGVRSIPSRALIAAICALVSAPLFAAAASPTQALASNEKFCEFATIPATTYCPDGTFRHITRVNAKSINVSVCAGAYNSNGIEVGGWTCTPAEGGGETSNGNYDGTKFLKGAILNNAMTTQTLGYGLEFYEP